ncbi:S-adenosyl-L-methionine-dependent methyltransferase [Cytidiella melzeri]|nr:S-adenosyl-L-methionine-dependent methyltransferase [Cytidiella melzeri]
MPANRTTRMAGRARGPIPAPPGEASTSSHIGRDPLGAHAPQVHSEYIGTNPKELLRRYLRLQAKSATRSSRRLSASVEKSTSPSASQSGVFASESEASETEADSYAVEPLLQDDDDSIDAITDSLLATLPDTHYEAADDEEEEGPEFIVHNETPVEDVDNPDDLPIRSLTDFAVYDISAANRFVPFSPDIGLNQAEIYGASGYVAAWAEPDSGSEDSSDDNAMSEDGIASPLQRISLPRILSVDVHWVVESSKTKLFLDPRVHQYCYAWYILDRPSHDYVTFYAPFWTKHFIFHQLVTSAFQDQALSYNKFIAALKESLVPRRIIGEELSARHVGCHSTHGYVISVFEDIRRDHERLMRQLEDVPAVRKIRRPKANNIKKGNSTKQPMPRKARATVVTHKLHALCMELFPYNRFEVCGPVPRALSPEDDGLQYPVHEGNPLSVRWDKEATLKPNHYSAVVVDGVTYQTGDTIIVERGDDENKKRAAIATHNSWANQQWYAKICYFFEDETTGEKMYHAQWYEHATQTLLQQAAHPRSLYLIDECSDQHVNSIYQRCNVRVLAVDEDEPSAQDGGYFTGWVWDRDNTMFFQRREEDVRDALAQCDPAKPCVSCGMDSLEEQRVLWDVLDDGTLVQGAVCYHTNDLVYIHPLGTETDVYILGQITAIYAAPHKDKSPTFDVKMYQRFDLVARYHNKTQFGNQEYDERRLYQTKETLEDVEAIRIEGKAFLVHRAALSKDGLEDWLSQSYDHFFVDLYSDSMRPGSLDNLMELPQHSFKPCQSCNGERVEKMQARQMLLRSRKPLRGLELFAGAGGLSTGFDQSGFVKTEWAVEMEPSAVLSYNENHPHTKVYNGDVNVLLKHAIETSEGKRPRPLSTVEGIEMPPMPRPGEVDFIYGGPPCQGFSGMNHVKKVDDPRNTLACNMLSYVDFYRPSYFLLENVDALLYAKLQAEQDGAKQVGGIKQGMVKFILRALISLGYQVHFKVLQAGQYGSPQSRVRVIFWGSKNTLPLPQFPIPTHCTRDDVDKYNLTTGQRLWPAVRVRPHKYDNLQDWLQVAPLLPVTVEDAIGDLPAFDWINPHKIMPQTATDIRECEERRALGIRRFSAVTDRQNSHCGYDNGEAYHSQPLNRYQKWMRAKVGEDRHVYYHYTARFSALIVERTCNVPLLQDANHADLPGPLRLNARYSKTPGVSKSEYKTLFGRIDAKGPFSTALTTASPSHKGGKVIHPTQKRILTVREFARSQGFPDDQRFLSRNDAAFADQYKQIGNAVPVPLALALGRTLGETLLKVWQEEDDRLRDQSPEIPMDLD